ncbi:MULTISPECIES: type II toxin-antitoxin system HicA family toxin [unclassified Cyanobium]|uniref:type II toxin-antitoxin system HicA family toxin n=1 Tax=unclassified Cyanobium TaxID=2627006 RepID=UPI0029D58C63|nr:type II toxin-antitoxin system HicA family toxin [Cyanobium sp. La Preciosa 7G6]MCP9936196.1 type II toxin-antitoxin system HicA family toxin [Cyanobium sp. Aljojuca 7A6]
MTRYSAVSGKTLIAVFKRIGFEEIRVKGSHHFLKHPDGRTTVVPIHSNETLGPGLLASILRDVKLSRSGLQDLL